MELNKIFATNYSINKEPKKITRQRPTKKELYKKEREEILNKINSILGISKDNNNIYLYDIENDEEKKQKILALSEDVKKYFKAGDWGVFKTELCKNNAILLFKSIYKEINYQILAKNAYIKRNDVKINTREYTIGKISITM